MFMRLVWPVFSAKNDQNAFGFRSHRSCAMFLLLRQPLLGLLYGTKRHGSKKGDGSIYYNCKPSVGFLKNEK
jgi:hypothetical protein